MCHIVWQIVDSDLHLYYMLSNVTQTSYIMYKLYHTTDTDAEKQTDDVDMTLSNSFMQSRSFSRPSVDVTTSVQ